MIRRHIDSYSGGPLSVKEFVLWEARALNRAWLTSGPSKSWIRGFPRVSPVCVSTIFRLPEPLGPCPSAEVSCWLATHWAVALFDRVRGTKKVREERDEAKLIHLRVFIVFSLPFLSALNNFVCSSSVFSLTSSLPQRFEFSQGNL